MKEDVNNIDVPPNKKNNEIVTRNKAQLIAQDYAQINEVDFDEDSTPIILLKVIIMLLSL